MQKADQTVAKGGRQATGVPLGTAAGLRRRATSTSTSSSARKNQQQQFYTDDTPGLKISPVVVIGMSLGFILFVTVLHVVGKSDNQCYHPVYCSCAASKPGVDLIKHSTSTVDMVEWWT
eukprot:gene3448-13506_t